MELKRHRSSPDSKLGCRNGGIGTLGLSTGDNPVGPIPVVIHIKAILFTPYLVDVLGYV
jgi:hypothetical protein